MVTRNDAFLLIFCSALAWLTNGRRFGAGVNLGKVLVSLPALSGALAARLDRYEITWS
jgi:hypothetical protein